MKKLFVLTVLSMLFISVNAQIPVDSDSKLIIYQEVVDQDGIKDTLYNRAIVWVNSYFKNPQGVTSIRDAENGKIVGKHRIRMVDTDEDGNILNSNTIVPFHFKIEAKENRYRYTIYDFTMKTTSKFPLERWLDKEDAMYTPKWEIYLNQVDTHIRELIKDLAEGMKKVKVKDDNW